ncbi:scaffolding protein [Aeromonas phage vB_AspA_Tola]|nr:scaffolding protein [Aeromonas phage vB_AspA_Tola]
MSYTITELDGKPTSAVADVKESEEVTTEVTETTETTTETTEVAETEVTDETSGMFWGDLAVEVSVPDEINAAFAEKGIDGQAILGELFAKDGKFELKEDTKAKLYDAFGKSLVDGYLNLYKGQNEMAVSQYKAEYDSQQATLASNAKEFSELIPDDQWGELDSWCAEALPEQELAAFNAVMSLPAEHWMAQKTVLQALMSKRQAALAESQGDGSVNLLGDDTSQAKAPVTGLPQTLTRSEFQSLMFSERYQNDSAYASQVDAIRLKSQKSGIH